MADNPAVLDGPVSLFHTATGVAYGDIEIDGVHLAPGSTEAAARLGIAMVSQEFPLVGQLSVAENLLLGRRPRQTRRRVLLDRAAVRAEAEAMLSDIGLDPRAIGVHREVRTLPVPTRQMIEIAKAMLPRPRILVLDEPSAGLNRDEREDLARFILRIKHELAVTMIWIEHDMQMVADLADRIHVLDYGRTLAQGAPGEVLNDARVIAAYLGS